MVPGCLTVPKSPRGQIRQIAKSLDEIVHADVRIGGEIASRHAAEQ